MLGKDPPIHTKKLVKGIFTDYEQAADFLKQRLSSSRSKVRESVFDAELIDALTSDLDTEVLTFLRDGLKVKTEEGNEITDFDGFIPETQIWIEVTSTSKGVDEHFFDKLGRLMFCKNQPIILQTHEFDPEKLEPKPCERQVTLTSLRLFYVSLYPIRVKINDKQLSFKGFSFLDDSSPQKIRNFIASEQFLEKLYQRFCQIKSELTGFVKACGKET